MAKPISRIVPHKEAKGTDIFGTNSGIWIIRSDLGCYLMPQDKKSEVPETDNAPKGSKQPGSKEGASQPRSKEGASQPRSKEGASQPRSKEGASKPEDKPYKIMPLHPAHTFGDHYFASFDNTKFCTIKGDYCRTTSSLTTDENSNSFKLHEKCRGGDHYILVPNTVYLIIFEEKRILRGCYDLRTCSHSSDYDLPGYWEGGIYSWHRKKDITVDVPDEWIICMARQVDEWGFWYDEILFHRVNASKLIDSKKSFPLDLINFLPGGLALTMGSISNSSWTCLKSIDNTEGSTDIEWSDEITMTVGHSKSISQQLEHHWDFSCVSDMGITSKIVTAQLSLSGAYGGKHINTKQESWSEQRQHKETIRVTVPKEKAMYFWQYKFKLGDQNALFSQHCAFTSENKQPEVKFYADS